MDERDTSAIVMGFCAPHQEVLWWVDGYEGDEHMLNLHNRFADYVVNGNTFIILEYHPNGWKGKSDADSLGERAAWWDDQLREQGYDIFEAEGM